MNTVKSHNVIYLEYRYVMSTTTAIHQDAYTLKSTYPLFKASQKKIFLSEISNKLESNPKQISKPKLGAERYLRQEQ